MGETGEFTFFSESATPERDPIFTSSQRLDDPRDLWGWDSGPKHLGISS